MPDFESAKYEYVYLSIGQELSSGTSLLRCSEKIELVLHLAILISLRFSSSTETASTENCCHLWLSVATFCIG